MPKQQDVEYAAESRGVTVPPWAMWLHVGTAEQAAGC